MMHLDVPQITISLNNIQFPNSQKYVKGLVELKTIHSAKPLKEEAIQDKPKHSLETFWWMQK